MALNQLLSLKKNSRDIKKIKLAVLISGAGTNAAAIQQSIIRNTLDASIEVLLSSSHEASGNQIAHNHNLPLEVVVKGSTMSRDDHSENISMRLATYQFDVIVLAGFMHIITNKLLDAYPNKIINLHPSLLPKHKGLHTYRDVLASDDAIHGSTVHIVNEGVDEGPVLAQSIMPVLPDDTEESLRERGKKAEWQLLPRVIALLARDKIILHDYASPIRFRFY